MHRRGLASGARICAGPLPRVASPRLPPAMPALPHALSRSSRVSQPSHAGPGRSPDRADALVWALTDLCLSRRANPRVWVHGA